MSHVDIYCDGSMVGRALLTRQTDSEVADNATKVYNNIGFTGADARSATLTAKYFMKHGTLQDWQIERWTKQNKNGVMRLVKYAKQLNEIAIEKAKQ